MDRDDRSCQRGVRWRELPVSWQQVRRRYRLGLGSAARLVLAGQAADPQRPAVRRQELLEQLGQVAVVAFRLGLVPRIRAPSPAEWAVTSVRSRGPPATRAGRRKNGRWFENKRRR